MVWASLILCDCRYVVIPWTPNKVKLTPSFCSMATRSNNYGNIKSFQEEDTNRGVETNAK